MDFNYSEFAIGTIAASPQHAVSPINLSINTLKNPTNESPAQE
jgi:hypothetical protein